jgi:predicted DCC family thiol-disulfide oxidoreductase YuxK
LGAGNQKPRLVYDGICNLCTSTVRFLYRLQGEALVQYVPFQNLSSAVRRKYALTETALQGRMYLIRRDGSLAGGPFAIVEICKLLTPFSFLCNLFRTPFAQRLYNWVAQRRYRIFGCRESCYVVK